MCVVHHFALGDGMISIKPITMPYMAYRVGCVFTCRETPIQYTHSYKYLGVEFTEYHSWAKSVENTAISANKAASYLIAD